MNNEDLAGKMEMKHNIVNVIVPGSDRGKVNDEQTCGKA